MCCYVSVYDNIMIDITYNLAWSKAAISEVIAIFKFLLKEEEEEDWAASCCTVSW